ncbi:MAG: hypothetical protein JST59_01805 [Actinobacteria bacterium]|nr:hypothetical protein [Actinomycetota bacterium]
MDSAFIDELSAVLNFHIRIYQVLSRNPEQYVNGGLLMRHLYNIIVHRLISYYNTNLKVQYRDVLASYCSMFGSTYQELLTSKLQMCLLYNILKIVAPMNEQEQVDLTAVFVYLKANPQPQLLKEKVFCLFARLNELIDERSYRLLNSAGEDARAQKSVRTHLWPQLYIFCSLNLNFITLKLEEVVKQIITHRLPSLLSFLGLRYQMVDEWLRRTTPQSCLWRRFTTAPSTTKSKPSSSASSSSIPRSSTSWRS